jgi:putative nucleotidyltransferase with HDIG domain
MRTLDEKAAGEAQALMRRIPAFPPVAIRVLHLLQDDDVPVDQLVELMRADPAFSAELLRRANSPLFGFHSEVVSLKQALILLGFRRVRGLALTVATGMYLRKAAQVGELRKFWRYSLACALLAEELARACGLPEDTAYTAGLLHDIGRLGLMVAHPEQYAQLIRHASEQLETGQPVDIVQLERDLFGVDHYEVGRWLAEDWKLPPLLAEIAGRHPWEVTRQWNIIGVVRLGCQLAMALGFGVLPSPHTPSVKALLAELPEPVRKRLPADPDLFGEEVRRKLAELDIESFGLPEPVPKPVAASPPQTGEASAAADAAPALSSPPETAQEVSQDDRNLVGLGEILAWLLIASVFAALLLVVLLKFLPV